jgi:hypothetical protein
MAFSGVFFNRIGRIRPLLVSLCVPLPERDLKNLTIGKLPPVIPGAEVFFGPEDEV